MDCREACELIMKYLDKDITGEEEELLYEHLDSCESCSLEFQTLKDTFSLMDDMEFEEAPEGLEMAVISRIKREDSEKAKLEGYIIVLGVLTALIAGWIGITGLFIYTPVFGIISDSFSNFRILISELLGFAVFLWKVGFSAAVKLLTLGRAFNVVQRAVIETYSMIIVLMILLMVVVLDLYSRMFKTIRR